MKRKKLQVMMQVQDKNHNNSILKMAEMGMKPIEIAKELGLGIGEVKFVMDLYKSPSEPAAVTRSIAIFFSTFDPPFCWKDEKKKRAEVFSSALLVAGAEGRTRTGT